MKTFVIIMLFFLSNSSVKSQDTAKIVAKAEQIKISSAELLKGKENTQDFCKNLESAKLYFDRFLIVGPKLWDKLKTIPEFKKIEQGNVTFKVPKFEKDNTWKVTEGMEGKAFQTADDFIALWNYLETTFALSKATLSDLNTADKFIYWQYFAKLEEGTTAITFNGNRFILQFAKNKIFFIEMTAD